MRRRGPRPEGRVDAGFSLVELLVTVLITGLLVPLVFSVLITAQRQTTATTDTAEAVDDVRLALSSVERRVRSASAPLYIGPATASTGRAQGFGFATRFAADGSALAAADAPQCVQYTVVSGALRTRSFPASATTRPAWTSTAAPVVVSDVVPWPTGTPTRGTTFAADPAVTRSVTVHLEVQRRTGSTATVERVLTARNPAGTSITCADFS